MPAAQVVQDADKFWQTAMLDSSKCELQPVSLPPFLRMFRELNRLRSAILDRREAADVFVMLQKWRAGRFPGLNGANGYEEFLIAVVREWLIEELERYRKAPRCGLALPVTCVLVLGLAEVSRLPLAMQASRSAPWRFICGGMASRCSLTFQTARTCQHLG